MPKCLFAAAKEHAWKCCSGSITWNFHLMKFELLPWKAGSFLPSHSLTNCGLLGIFSQYNCRTFSAVWWNAHGCCQTTPIIFAFPLSLFHNTVGEWVLRSYFLCWLHWSRTELGQLWKFGPRSLMRALSLELQPCSGLSDTVGISLMQKITRKKISYDAVKPSLIWKWL